MHVGELRVDGVSDCTFVERPYYLGTAVPCDARPDFFDQDGAASLPLVSRYVTLQLVEPNEHGQTGGY